MNAESGSETMNHGLGHETALGAGRFAAPGDLKFGDKANSQVHREVYSTRWRAIVIICWATVLRGSAIGEPFLPPTKPDIAPLIAQNYPTDADGDRIEDALADKAREASLAVKAAGTPEDTASAQAALARMIDVELVFKQPITQQQIDAFLALGGEMTYVYKAVSYGWNGRLPLGKVSEIPAAMGETMVLIEEAKPATTALYEATRTGRVRPIWAPGFAGSVSGFEGNTNTTIAVIDTETDDTHPDLAGRRVYWTNFTDESAPGSGPVGFHATMVTGVAVGTGAASGANTGPLFLTQSGSLAGFTNGRFSPPLSMELPVGEVTLAISGKWLGGGSTMMGVISFPKGRTITSPYPPYPGQVTLAQTYGASPLTLTCTVTGDVDHVFTPVLVANGSNTDFVIACQISNYPGLGDGFNKLRGVAPRLQLGQCQGRSG